MANSYFLDKRVLKRGFIKVLIEFAIIFPLLVLFNYLIGNSLKGWLVVFIDVVIALVLYIAIGVLYNKIYDNLKEKKERRIKEFRERQKQEEKNQNSEINEQIVKPAKVKSVKKKRKRRVRKG